VNALVQRLRAEIRFDREAFAKRVAELGSVDLSPASGPAPQAQAAVALHHAYGSIEAIMTRLARQIDGNLPAGADWHQSLLHVMGLAIEGVRPVGS